MTVDCEVTPTLGWRPFIVSTPKPTESPDKVTYAAGGDDYIRRFYESLKSWRMEIGFSSSAMMAMQGPSFRDIVSIGQPAVPLIVQELRREPSLLFLALHEITKENPVPRSAQGDILKIVDAWLRWADRDRRNAA